MGGRLAGSHETLPSLPFTARTPRVRHVEVHPSGRLLVLVSNTVMLAANVGATPRGLPGRTHDATAAAMSPDGRRVAIATRQRAVVIRDPAAAPVLLEIELPAVPVALAWVDDGRVVAATAHSGIVLLDGTSGRLLATLFEPRSDSAFGGFAVARRQGVLVHAHGVRLRSVEIDTGRVMWERALEGEPRCPDIAGDGTRIVATGPVGTEGGPWQRLSPTRPIALRPESAPSPTPADGRRRGLRVLHLADGSDVAAGPPFAWAGVRVGGHTLTFLPRPTFSPDGTRIAVNLPNGTLALYDAATLRPEQVVPRSDVLAWIEDLAFTPDGGTLVFGTRHDHIGRFSIAEHGLSASIEGLDPELAGSEAPRPWVAAVASFLVPGLGQLFNGQVGKAAACVVVWGLTLGLCGVLNLVYAVDASRIARRLAEGEDVRPWQFF